MTTAMYPKIVVKNPKPKGEHPGKILKWDDLVKYNGSVSMAGYEKIVLTHSAN